MEKRTKTINGREYALLLPPARKAMILCSKVAVLIGPSLASLGMDIKNAGWAKFAQAVAGIHPDRLDALFMEAVQISGLCYNNQPISTEIDFERHFGNYRGDIYMVCSWALMECVRDFFPQLPDFDQMLAKMGTPGAEEQSASPKAGL